MPQLPQSSRGARRAVAQRARSDALLGILILYNTLPRQPVPDTDTERLKKLRHDLSNPLSAMLAEVQLLLLDEATLDEGVRTSLRDVEALAIRMRAMLREL